MNGSFLLGAVVGVLVACIVVLGAFVYFETPPILGDAVASSTGRGRGAASTCDRLAAIGGHELVVDLARYANDHEPDADIVIGRKSDDELCGLAMSSLSANLPAADFAQLLDCTAKAQTQSSARACFVR